MPRFDLALDVTWLTLLSVFVLPMITALVTNRVAHPGAKAAVLALLSFITAAVNDLLEADGFGSFELSPLLATTLGVFLGSVGMHYGLLKPVALTGANGTIARAVPAGVGGPREPHVLD